MSSEWNLVCPIPAGIQQAHNSSTARVDRVICFRIALMVFVNEKALDTPVLKTTFHSSFAHLYQSILPGGQARIMLVFGSAGYRPCGGFCGMTICFYAGHLYLPLISRSISVWPRRIFRRVEAAFFSVKSSPETSLIPEPHKAKGTGSRVCVLSVTGV